MEEFDEADAEDALNKDGDDNLAKREKTKIVKTTVIMTTEWTRTMMMKPNGAT